MMHPDDELLQAWLDRDLDADEIARVERLLASDDDAKQRAADLQRIASLIDELEENDPPAALAPAVMSRVRAAQGRVAECDDSRMATAGPMQDVRWGSRRFNGGMSMARKAMWAVGAAAALALAVFAIRGYPPVGRGTEGTIGAAKRAQTEQIAGKDVVLGDARAQEFLQSEVFDRLMKDPNARQMLSNASLRVALADSAFRASLASSDLRSALASSELRMALANADLRAALANAEIRAALASAEFRAALAQPELQASLAGAELKAALADSALQRALASPDMRASFADAQMQAAFASASFRDALASAEIRAALADANLQAAFASQAFQAALASQAFQQALQASGFESALHSAQFEAALRQ
jgi:hypothetical protein